MAHDLEREREHLHVEADHRRHVLVGLDGSRASRHALDYAFGLAARQSARLTAIHVWRPWAFYEGLGGGGILTLEPDRALAGSLCAEVESMARQCFIDATYLEIPDPGPASRALARIAQDFHADALVVGATRGPLHRYVGSAGSHLIKHCACPVTVVP
jgi:nucleotide-binding universal stress UspA family protein